MTTYLTDKAIFRCSSNPGIMFSCSDKSQRKLAYNGQAVLTKNASLSSLTSPPVPCPILTAMAQTPTFCKGKFSPWLPAGISFTVRAGSALLTSDASCNCLICPGQTIGLFKDFGNLPGFLYKGDTVQITPPQTLALLAAVETPAIPEWKPFARTGAPLATAAPQGNERGLAAGTAKLGQDNVGGNESEAEEDEDRLEYKCSTCAKKCDLKETYKGRTPDWDGAPLDLGNNPVSLRKNYKLYLGCQYCARDCANAKHKTAPEGEPKIKAATKADLRYCKLDKTVFSFQAHHLISGNQVFQELPQGNGSDYKYTNESILRMAHVCDYDVNRAQNCIMLVSDQDDDEDKGPELKLKQDEKVAKESKKALNAFEAMQEGKLQWHVGNHSYKFEAEALRQLKARIEFYTKKPVGKTIPVYAEELSNKLLKMDQRIKRQVNTHRQPICPRAFIEEMDKLSAKIREYLEAFENGYHLSYPYYVSKRAYNFAFQLPQTFTVMTIRRTGQGIEAKKFRISRKVKQAAGEDNISVALLKPPAGFQYEDYTEKTFPEPLNREEFIRFSGNLEYFIFFGQTGPATLPFSIAPAQVSKVSSGNENTEAYVRNHAYELMVWIMANPVKYKGISARVNERLGIVKGS